MAQYGGVKGCGTDHFLIDTWENILQELEDNRASVNLMSLDYSKAFNRMGIGTSGMFGSICKKGRLQPNPPIHCFLFV